MVKDKTNLTFFGGVNEIGGSAREFQSHCSGQTYGKELLEMVRRISARKVFPVPTEHPQVFRKALKNVQVAREAVEYEL